MSLQTIAIILCVAVAAMLLASNFRDGWKKGVAPSLLMLAGWFILGAIALWWPSSPTDYPSDSDFVEATAKGDSR